MCTRVIVLLLAALPAVAATCESLSGAALPDTTITVAQSVPAGAFTPPYGNAHRQAARILPRGRA